MAYLDILMREPVWLCLLTLCALTVSVPLHFSLLFPQHFLHVLLTLWIGRNRSQLGSTHPIHQGRPVPRITTSFAKFRGVIFRGRCAAKNRIPPSERREGEYCARPVTQKAQWSNRHPPPESGRHRELEIAARVLL